MKFIKSSAELIKQPSGIEGLYKQIELAGRTCYKSENRITSDSAKGFVEMLKKSGHGAMLEHGTVCLAMPMETIIPIEANGWGKYTKNPYSKGCKVYEVNGERRVAITTNLRVLAENDWLDDLKYLCEPTEYHEKRYTVKFICDRGVSHELVRHRVFSFAQESTRYCNYSTNKFGNELTYIIPSWITEEYPTNPNKIGLEDIRLWHESFGETYGNFLYALKEAEESYFNLLKCGWKPQQARAVLPNALKTELVMTGYISDWKHFLSLRSPKYGATGMHPDAAKLADQVYDLFLNEGILNN